MKQFVFLTVLLLTTVFLPGQARSEKDGGTTLIVMGQGATLDEATKVALRSAIEQTFRVFVSSSTTVVNDAMVDDRISTVSSGNISKYEYISKKQTADGSYNVTLRATVVVNKLLSYVEASNIPGVPANLNGATFAMNVKLGMLYRQNELYAIEDMIKAISGMAENMISPNPQLQVKEPVSQDGKTYQVAVSAQVNFNKEAVKDYTAYLYQTLSALSLTEGQADALKDLSITPTLMQCPEWPDGKRMPNRLFILRNNPVMLANALNKLSVPFAVMHQVARNVVVRDGLHRYRVEFSDRARPTHFLLGHYGESFSGYSSTLDKDLVAQYNINSNNTPEIGLDLYLPLDYTQPFATAEGKINYTLDDLQKVSQIIAEPITVSPEFKEQWRNYWETDNHLLDFNIRPWY